MRSYWVRVHPKSTGWHLGRRPGETQREEGRMSTETEVGVENTRAHGM